MHAAPHHPVWSSNIALHFFTAVVWVWQRTVRQTNHSADWASALRSLKPRSYHWAITELHVDYCRAPSYTSNGKNQPMCAILLGAMCLCIHCMADPSIYENKIHWSWFLKKAAEIRIRRLWHFICRSFPVVQLSSSGDRSICAKLKKADLSQRWPSLSTKLGAGLN